MHLVFGLRGQKDIAKRFIDELSTRYAPTRTYNQATKKFEDTNLQIRVCPIQLWDVSFPEEHMDVVLNTILQGKKGLSANKHIDRLAWPLRKAFKLQPIPDYNAKNLMVMQSPEHMDILAIGIKKDKWYNSIKGKIYDKKEDIPEDEKGECYEGI